MSGRGQGGGGLGATSIFRIGEDINDDVVSNLKNWILTKGSNFLVKWKSNIGDKKIDGNMKKIYIEQQKKENDPVADEILKNILDSIQYVGIDSILNTMRDLSRKFSTSLNGDKFYIILNPSEDNKCTPGSNMFTSIMYLILNPSLVPLLEGFICGGILLNGDSIDTNIEHYLYVDDLAISGNDVKTAIISTQTYIEPESRLHVMISYVSKSARRSINSGLKDLNTIMGDLHGTSDSKLPFSLYTDEKISPKTLSEQNWLKPSMALWKKQKGDGDNLGNYFKRLMVFLLGKHNFNKGDVTALSKITLFYTDINAPSEDSIYPMLLFKPSIFVPSGRQLKHLTGSIVSGCRIAETEDEISLSKKGEFCVTRPHQNTEWTVFIKNLNSLDSASSTVRDVVEKELEIKRVFVEEPKEEETKLEIKRVRVEEPKEEEPNWTISELNVLLSKDDGFERETIQAIKKRFFGNEEKTMTEIKNLLFKRCELKDQTMARIRKSLFG